MSLCDIAYICSKHFQLLLESRGEITGSNLMRKHFANYIKGFPGAATFRQNLVTASDTNSMRKYLDDFMQMAEESDKSRRSA